MTVAARAQPTPAATIEKLNAAINAILAKPEVERAAGRARRHGDRRLGGRVREAIADETEKWAKVITISGAKVD